MNHADGILMMITSNALQKYRVLVDTVSNDFFYTLYLSIYWNFLLKNLRFED